MTNHDKEYIRKMIYTGIFFTVIAIISASVAIMSTLIQAFYDLSYLKIIAMISSLLAAGSIYAILVITKKIGKYLHEKNISDDDFDDFLKTL